MFKQQLRFDERLIVEDLLASSPLFKNISTEGRNALVDKFNGKAFQDGEVVITADTACDSLLLVMRGNCLVSFGGIPIQHLREGEYFGETLLVGVEDVWSVTLVAEGVASVAEITRDDFYELLEGFPEDRQLFAGLSVKHRSCMHDGVTHHTCDIFAALSNRTLVELEGALVRRMFWPGEKLLVQGVAGDELYVLLHGMVNIEVGGHVVAKEGRDTMSTAISPQRMQRLSIASQSTNQKENNGCLCFGEPGLLGLQPKRVATVVAVTVCQVRVLYRPVFLKLLQEKPEAVDLQPMFEFAQTRINGTPGSGPLNKCLKDVRLFQELRCGEEFLDFLASHMQERIFISGQRIVTEGSSEDRCMYILDRGNARVYKGDMLVTTLEPGAVVGEVFLLGLALERTSTIIAEGTAYMLSLDQATVIHALQQFPEERSKVMMMAFRREHQPQDEGGEEKSAADDALDPVTGSPRSPSTEMERGDDQWIRMALQIVIKAMAKSDMFPQQAGSAFVEELGQVALNHVYMPGEHVMEEGASGNSMFIMISGMASVYTGKPGAGFLRLGKLTAGSISGELAMLGVSQTRSATIEAETFCCMWEITHSCALPIINRFPQLRDNFADIVVRNLQHTVPARMDSLPLFRGFDRKFPMMLSQYCDRKAYFCGQAIFKEASAGDGLCVMNLGRGMLTRKGYNVKAFSSGSHFNSTIMLGVHKSPICTLTATQTCHVVIVPRMAYLQALEMYPCHENHQRILQHESSEADKFRKLVERMYVRANLWKKSQEEQQESKPYARQALPDHEYLRRCFGEWARRLAITQKRRQELERSRKSIDDWIRQRRETTAAVLEKRKAAVGDGDDSPRMRGVSRADVQEKCRQRCQEFAYVYLNWRELDTRAAPRMIFSSQRSRTADAGKWRTLPPMGPSEEQAQAPQSAGGRVVRVPTRPVTPPSGGGGRSKSFKRGGHFVLGAQTP